MRINKYLAESGVASRRACDQIINEGRVKINGRIAKCGDDVNEYSDSVSVDGKKVSPAKKFEYYVMNKPKGYVCTVNVYVSDLLSRGETRLRFRRNVVVYERRGFCEQAYASEQRDT